jgi:hypothetical protein
VNNAEKNFIFLDFSRFARCAYRRGARIWVEWREWISSGDAVQREERLACGVSLT